MSGALYVGIIAMWAVVLIPMWLRKEEDTDPTRSIGRFHAAMDTLRNDVGAVADRVRGGSSVAIEEIADPTEALAAARRRRRARARAAARRRQVLAILTALLFVTLVLVAFKVLPVVFVAVPVGLLAAFVIAARRAVSAAAAADRAHRKLHQVTASTRSELRRAGSPAETTRSSATSTAPAVSSSERGPVVVRRGQRALDPAPRPVVADGPRPVERWEPMPTTLPTYVTAPAATRVPRVIDLTTPGAWSGQAMVEQAMRGPEEAAFAGASEAVAEDMIDLTDARPAAPQPATSFAERFVTDDETDLDLGDDSAFWQRAPTG